MINESEIVSAICEMINGGRMSFSIDEIVSLLSVRKVDFTQHDRDIVKRYIQTMERSGKLRKKVRKGKIVYSITSKFIENLSNKSESIKCGGFLEKFIKGSQLPIPKDEYDIEEELGRIYELPLPEALAKIARMGSFEKVFASAIRYLVEENPNPKDLLLGYLKFLKELYGKILEEYNKSTSGIYRTQLGNVLNQIKTTVVHVFQRVLSIPVCFGNPEYPCPIRLPRDLGQRNIEFDEKIVKEFLDKRIPDNKFFIEEEIRVYKGVYSGVDSSVVELSLREHPRLEKYPHLPDLYLFTRAIARRKWTGEWKLIFYPEPDKLSTSALEELEKNGYILPLKAVINLDEYYIKRTEEALMQYHEYDGMMNEMEASDNKDGSLLYNPSLHTYNNYNTEKVGVTVIYKDGSLLPVERDVNDFFYDHREYTIKTLKKFYELLLRTGVTERMPIIAGVVKRGHLGLLWHILAYLVLKDVMKDGYFVDKVLRLLDFLERQESMDGYLALRLLLAYVDAHKLPKGKTVRLFSIIRKFYATDDELTKGLLKYAALTRQDRVLELEDDIEVWQAIVWALIMEKDRTGIGEELKHYFNEDGIIPQGLEDIEPLLRELKKANFKITGIDSFIKLYLVLREKNDSILSNFILDPLTYDLMNIYPYVISYADTIFFYFLPSIVINKITDYKNILKGDSTFISLPRYEILYNREHMKKSPLIYISKVIVEPFAQFYLAYERSENVKHMLVVPAPIVDAHKLAKALSDTGVDYYRKLIVNMIILLLQEED